MKQFSFYKNGTILLLIWCGIICFGCFNVLFLSFSHLDQQIFAYSFKTETKEANMAGFLKETASEPPVMNVSYMKRDFIIDVSKDDYNNLLRIVEAEAGGEDLIGKLLVANVIINRVKDEDFPDTVTDVIFQKENGVSQFSPVSDGRFYEVDVSENTVKAVNAALYGRDESEGALFFMARKYVSEKKAKWFDQKLTWLFQYGGHEFFS